MRCVSEPAKQSQMHSHTHYHSSANTENINFTNSITLNYTQEGDVHCFAKTAEGINFFTQSFITYPGTRSTLFLPMTGFIISGKGRKKCTKFVLALKQFRCNFIISLV